MKTPEVLKGRAIGALICGGFGGLWLLYALKLGGVTAPGWLVAMWIAMALFVLFPVARLISLHRTFFAWPRIPTAYWMIVGACYLTLNLGINWLDSIGRSDLRLQFIGVVVGLHFLPLARLFRARIYYWTGAAMILGVTAALGIPAGSVRNLVACGSGAVSLWLTAAIILCQDRLSTRLNHHAPVAAKS
ncbi:MAG: hypothetical protein ACRD30_00145 [Bryobacteraceae bacterium]